VLQPLLVKAVGDGEYELVSGERRLKAAERAGLKSVPAIVVDPEEASGSLIIALVENVQRADLNAIELARAYLQLQEEFGRTQEEIARAVGKSRPHVANTLRLLELDDLIQEALSEGRITAGHARALLMAPVEARELLLRRMVDREMSVRQAERAARAASRPKRKAGAESGKAGEDPSVGHMIGEMERVLETSLGRKVRIDRTRKGTGRVVMEFYGDRDLESLVERLRG
jgi:ParB family chromosome partitioning protein